MGKLARETNLSELVGSYVRPGVDLAIGGLHFHNTPMAAVREIVRQQTQLGLLIPPIDGSINADLLIGAGLVEEIIAPYVGFEQFGMAGRFRAAAERGRLRVRETEEVGFVFGLLAGATGVPFAVLPAGIFPEDKEGSPPNIPKVNRNDYATVVDPFSRRTVTVARAIRPDVALIHCQLVDRRGNGGFLGGVFLDVEIAKAAETCILVAEAMVDELPSDCAGYLPGFLVDAYCILEMGAHPSSSHGCYRQDENAIADYAVASRSDDGFARYVKNVVGESESAYQRNIGIETRTPQLRAAARGIR
jgi:glutaconate CoA-transferase subunit A